MLKIQIAGNPSAVRGDNIKDNTDKKKLHGLSP
jgi:hypothetical protein